MKLNKIKSLCKAARRVILYNELAQSGELRRQWIGTGDGMYLLEGLPILGTANIPPLMGLEGTAVERIKITQEKMPPDVDTGDYDANEAALISIPCTVNVNGVDLALFRSAYQVWALAAAELTPVLTQSVTVKMRWTPEGAPYFVVFKGMFLVAIFFRERSWMLDDASRNGLGLWLDWMKKAETTDEE
jgi:hypothetical protein